MIKKGEFYMYLCVYAHTHINSNGSYQVARVCQVLFPVLPTQ